MLVSRKYLDGNLSTLAWWMRDSCCCSKWIHFFLTGQWRWAICDVVVGPAHPRVLPDSSGSGHLQEEWLAPGQVNTVHFCYWGLRNAKNFYKPHFISTCSNTTFIYHKLILSCKLIWLPSCILHSSLIFTVYQSWPGDWEGTFRVLY